ncbi:MAG: PAS domain-containing protein [Gemmatimonadota bacterium]|nr:MAG: PAS domain-containing protein [Gemmatimonadota bacterium]
MPTSRRHELSEWGREIDARLRQAHLTKAVLAQQLRIHPSTLFRWLQSEPGSEADRLRLDRVLRQMEGTKPTAMTEARATADSGSAVAQMSELLAGLRGFRQEVAALLSAGEDAVPIHEVIYWIGRIIGVCDATIAGRNALAAVLSELPVALYHIGIDLSARWISSGAESLFGWTPAEVMERGPMSFLHPEDVAKAQSAAADMTATGRHEPFEVRVRNRDGCYTEVTAYGASVVDSNGSASGFITVLVPACWRGEEGGH